MVGFWLSILVNGKESKLSKPLNTVMLKEQENVLLLLFFVVVVFCCCFFYFKWISCVTDILYRFLLADQIFLELNQSTSQNMLKWVFHEHWICMLKNVNTKTNVSLKEKKTISILKNILSMSQNLIILKFTNIGLAIIGSQLRLDDGMMHH